MLASARSRVCGSWNNSEIEWLEFEHHLSTISHCLAISCLIWRASMPGRAHDNCWFKMGLQEQGRHSKRLLLMLLGAKITFVPMGKPATIWLHGTRHFTMLTVDVSHEGSDAMICKYLRHLWMLTCLARWQEQGMMSTVGSLGALLLWGIDEGLTQIDKCASWECWVDLFGPRTPKPLGVSLETLQLSLLVSVVHAYSIFIQSILQRFRSTLARAIRIARYQWSSDANLKVPEGEALSCAMITMALSEGCLNHRVLFKHIAAWCLLSIGLRPPFHRTIAACVLYIISVYSSCALWSYVKCEALMRGEAIKPLEKSTNNWLQRAPKISPDSRLLLKMS